VRPDLRVPVRRPRSGDPPRELRQRRGLPQASAELAAGQLADRPGSAVRCRDPRLRGEPHRGAGGGRRGDRQHGNQHRPRVHRRAGQRHRGADFRAAGARPAPSRAPGARRSPHARRHARDAHHSRARALRAHRRERSRQRGRQRQPRVNAAQEEQPMSRQIIHTERAPQAIGTYSQAVRAGDTVYLSGQVPLDPATMQLVSGDIEVQIRRVFENLKAVAEAAGGSLAHAVKMNVFLTDLAHFGKVNEIMASYCGKPYPARAVEGEVQLTEIAYRGRRQLLCRISDGSGMLTLRFFHFSASQQQGLARGTRLRCFGEVRRGALGLEMVHPEYRRLTGEAVPLDDTLTPIYPLTEGVPQGRLRSLIGEALRQLDRTALRDWLPRGAVLPPGLPSLGEALHYLHHPPRAAQLAELAAGRHPAQRRLAFEELLAHHLTLRLRKRALKADPAWALADGEGLARRFLAALPFALTRAQARALADAHQDLASGVPMVRLLLGDVGCGKTVVA